MDNQNSTQAAVQEYYGTVLQNSSDLKTNACCTPESVTHEHKAILNEIEADILDRYYGCGLPIPPLLDGLTILDLGCGAGRDAYLLSKLVGEKGHVIGVDMTDEQLEVARKHQDQQAKRFGFSKSNITFTKGLIENLEAAGISDNSVDLVVSNCVINLSTDKPAVYSEIARVLKPGGEMYISDVFCNRRIPEDLQGDPVLYGECLSGALYIEDFRRLLQSAGINDYRIVENRRLTIDTPEVQRKLENYEFYSLTVRAFKLPLEDQCEDFGQVAVYNGTIAGMPNQFILDDHHVFFTGKPVLVCGNTADMLSESRYNTHFTITGEKSTHFGLFDCRVPFSSTKQSEPAGCC